MRERTGRLGGLFGRKLEEAKLKEERAKTALARAKARIGNVMNAMQRTI